MKKLALAIPVLLAGLFTLATPSEAHAQTVVVRGGGTVHVGGGVRVRTGGGYYYHSHRGYYNYGTTYSQPSSMIVTVYETVNNYEQVSVADYDWRYDYGCGRWKWVQVGSHLEWQWVTRNVERRYTAYWYSNGYGGYYGYYDGNGNFRIANR